MALTFEQQLVQFKLSHGDKFLYIKSSYVDNKTKMIIICPEHGKFKQEPYSHKRGIGCPKCKAIKIKNTHTITKEQIEQQFYKCHGNKYTYDLSTYTNSSKKNENNMSHSW